MAKVTLENLGRSSLFGALAEVWRIGSRFLLTPIIIGAIGFTGYGTWTLLFSVAAYLSMANASFGVAYTKFTAECVHSGEYDRLAGILGAGIASVGAVAVVGLAATWWLSEPILRGLNVPVELQADARIALLIVMSTVVARLTIGCTLEVLSGLQRVDLSHRLGITASAVEFVVTVPLVLTGYGLLGMACGYALGQATCFALGWRWVRRHDAKIRISPRLATREGLRAVVRVGGSMQILALVTTVVVEGVKFMLSALIDPRATALYDLADKLVNLARAQTTAVIGPLLAAFADLQAGAEREAERLLALRASKAVAIVGATAAAFLAVLARPALMAWTGEDVPLAAWALQLMLLAEVFAQQTGVYSASQRARGLVRFEMVYAAVSTSTFVIALLPLASIAPFEAVIYARLVAVAIGASWYLRGSLRFAPMPVTQWWRGGRFLAIFVVVGAAAAMVALGHGLLPALPLPLSPRWIAALEVALWSVPYLAIVVVGVWRYALVDDERTSLADILRRKLARLRR